MPTPDSAADTSRPTGSGADPLPTRLDVLDGLAERPLDEHAAVYQGLHADLQAALAEIDSA
jgi:hypothetical protein